MYEIVVILYINSCDINCLLIIIQEILENNGNYGLHKQYLHSICKKSVFANCLLCTYVYLFCKISFKLALLVYSEHVILISLNTHSYIKTKHCFYVALQSYYIYIIHFLPIHLFPKCGLALLFLFSADFPEFLQLTCFFHWNGVFVLAARVQ